MFLVFQALKGEKEGQATMELDMMLQAKAGECQIAHEIAESFHVFFPDTTAWLNPTLLLG